MSDTAKEKAYELAGNSKIARHMLLTGSPEYRSAFSKWVQHPQQGMTLLTPGEQEAVRAAMSTTDANGGYLIPQQLDPTIILTNSGSANPFRQIARVVQGTANVWEGVSSAGVTAEWLGEGSQAADKTPTFGAPLVTAYKAAAYVFGSYEVLQDTNFEAQLGRLLADAKDNLEADAFAIGSGSAAPYGVVTSTTAVTASRVAPTTGGTFTSASAADVYKVIAALPPRHRSRASWVANFASYNVIRQMSASGQGSNFWANLGADVPEQLLGRPVYESSEMASAATTGSNILLAGDFSEYLIYDRVGMSLAYDPLVLGANQRPSGQAGFFAFWRVGADVTSVNAFRVLKL
jgi:HK97 family phage major capsid protein